MIAEVEGDQPDDATPGADDTENVALDDVQCVICHEARGARRQFRRYQWRVPARTCRGA